MINDIQPDNIDFKALVTTNNTKMTLNCQTKMITELQNSFTEYEQKWYIANFYIYLHYHPTNDYPINLENVYKILGFATKGNAKRVLENNFVVDEDYKSSFIPTDKREIGGSMVEIIKLNIDTFKNLCMLIKTNKGKEIRKYYVKLENIFNKIVNEERKEYELQLLQEKEKVKELENKVEEKDTLIELLENKPDIGGFGCRECGEVYCIRDTAKVGHYKIGMISTCNKHNSSFVRVGQLNCGSSTNSLELYVKYETFDAFFAEKLIHKALAPFKIKNRNEWFYFKNDIELAYAINTMKTSIEYIKKFDIKNYKEFTDITSKLIIQDELIKPEITKELQLENEKNAKDVLMHGLQGSNTQTGIFKGVCWITEKKMWCAQLQYNNNHEFLGYFTDEIDGAKVYNDYALFLNTTENTKFLLNDIPGYNTVARNIPELNKLIKNEKKSSKYNGVSYDTKRKYYVVSIGLANKTYNLGSSQDEVECAKLYNQQALFFNLDPVFKTKYILNEIEGLSTVTRSLRKPNHF